jgi:ABC-type multidrug transport system fused ATPase/permease subunit
MFCGTLRQNLDPFLLHSDSAVHDALELAGLHGKALDAEVGVSGQGWSIGEKQLVRSYG